MTKVWSYKYGSVGYIIEYVTIRKGRARKILLTVVLITIVAMVVFGFVIASLEGAPLSRVVAILELELVGMFSYNRCKESTGLIELYV